MSEPQLLTGPDYNTSTQTAYKMPLPLLPRSLVAMETCLFVELLLSSGRCIVACSTVVAQQQVYMSQYTTLHAVECETKF
jgi:hypothetical protein